MAKYNEKKISYEIQVEMFDSFCGTLSRLKTKAAIYNFLKDLLNRNERMMLMRRLLIAEMLLEGRTYEEITEQLRCGMPTISRVQRWLNFGRGGFVKAIRAKKKSRK